METYAGMRIHVSPFIKPVPVLSLHPDVLCTDAFRADMNDWLLRMFGEKEVCYVVGNDAVVISATVTPFINDLIRMGRK